LTIQANICRDHAITEAFLVVTPVRKQRTANPTIMTAVQNINGNTPALPFHESEK
jgi:hypothetical protein